MLFSHWTIFVNEYEHHTWKFYILKACTYSQKDNVYAMNVLFIVVIFYSRNFYVTNEHFENCFSVLVEYSKKQIFVTVCLSVIQWVIYIYQN